MTNELDALRCPSGAGLGRLAVVLLVGAALVSGCGNKSDEGPTQVVASVAGEELTESQVNHALERQPTFKPDQLDAVSRRVVAGLVEQQIVLQKARELKLDRDQRVVQNVEAAKREILTKAYLERIADGASKPTAVEIQAYFDANPALFKQRRIYSFQELTIEASDAQRKEIETRMASLKSPAELDAFLKARKIPVRASQSTVTAENVPLPLLQRVATLQPGQGLIVPAPGGLRVLLLLDAQDSPVGEEQARPAITAYLLSLRKRQVVEKEVASLRASAKVDYFGKYADMAGAAASGAASGAASSAVSMPAPAAASAAQVQQVDPK